MRDAVDFMAGLFTFRENPFFLRAWRKESRNSKLVRNHLVVLACLAALYAALHTLVARFGGEMARLGEAPGVVVLGVLSGVHTYIVLVAVSYRARESIDLELRQGTLDFVRVTAIPAIRAMGMRATYPLVFGILMPLPAFPLYMLAASCEGVRPTDVLVIYAVLVLICIRPSGHSGAWYTRQLLPNDERKKHLQRRNAGTAVAVQIVAQGWSRLLPRGYFGAPLHGGLLPLTWVLIGGRALFRARPFYGTEAAILCILLPLLPILYATLARGAYTSAIEDDAPVRWRRNPASALWGILGVTAVAGFTWRLIGPSATLAKFTGVAGADPASAMAAVAGALVVVWALGCAIGVLTTGRTDAGLWACGGGPAPSRKEALRRELLSSVSAVSVLVWPLLAVGLSALLGLQLPKVGLIGNVLLCSALALVVCYSAGRPGAIRSQLDNGKKRHPWRTIVVNLWMLVPVAGLFPACGLPSWVILLHPFAGWLLAYPGAVEAVTSNAYMVSALPDLATWMTVQVLLAVALMAANSRYAVVTAGMPALTEPKDLPPPPPTWRLFEAEPRRLRWIRDPISLRILRSRPWRAMFISFTTVGSVITIAGVAGAVYSPSTLASAFAGARLIAPSVAGSDLGDSLIAVLVIGFGLALMGGMGGCPALGSSAITQERLKETIEAIVQLPAPHWEIVRGYLGAALYGIGTYLFGLLPVAVLAAVAGCRPLNLVVAASLGLVLTVDAVLGVAVGMYGALSSPRGANVPAALVWIGSRIGLVMVAGFTLAGMTLGRANRLLIAAPAFWLVPVLEAPLIALALIGATRHLARMRRGEAALTVREERSRKRKGA